MSIKRIYTILEEIRREAGTVLPRVLRRVAVAAVVDNPFAGRHEEDLSMLMDLGEELGGLLGSKGAQLLAPSPVESYGKGAIIGLEGELEHAAALLHPKLGNPLRDAVGGGKAIIPSAKKIGAPGSTID